MSIPILEAPFRTVALGVLIFAGASLITALVGRRRPNRWLVAALLAALAGVWISGGIQ